MQLMKIQPEKLLTLFLLITVSLVWGQSGTSVRAADSSTPPTAFPAPTPAALATAAHAISGHAPGPSGQSPVTDLLKLLLANVNSTEAFKTMETMWSTDRYFDFARFQETAKNVAEMMRQAGLDDVEIGQGPADGVTQSGFWTQPLAWDAHSATLEIVSPQVPEDMRVLADYQKVPTSLCQWSGPTPAGGVEGELVERDRDSHNQDIRNADLKGKWVLGHRMSKTDLKQAGALGMVRESSVNRVLLDERDWENDFGDNGWAFNKNDTPTVCFSITPRAEQYLKELLQKGPVKLRAKVDTRYYSGTYPYVTGTILGTDGAAAEEVLSLGHLYEEGANDNSAGVASILEAITTLNRLIKEGKLPRPKRTIRMLAMGERYGTLWYLDNHKDRTKRTIAAMCIDTPAGWQYLAGTQFSWSMNPQSASSFVDAFTVRLAAEYFPMVGRPYSWTEYNHGAYYGGTDDDLGESMIGIPTTSPQSGHGIPAHHTSFDTPAQVDPKSLRDLAVMNAAYTYLLASAGPEQMHWMAELAVERGYDQINAGTANSLDLVAAAKDADSLGHLLYWEKARVDYNLARETRAVKQAADLKQELTALASFAAAQKVRIEGAVKDRATQLHLGKIQPMAPNFGPEAEKIIVRRKRMGALPLDEIPESQRAGFPDSGFWSPTMAALYWCDGKRNLAEVIQNTEMELGPQDKFAWVGYFKFLQRHGYVEFVQ
jgi:Peptidase family M28